MHILIADDEITARLLLQAALEKSGFQVSLAEDGADALRKFRAHACDVVMLDVEMPGLNGYQVCAQLRHEVGDELPIVMVTGMDDLDSIERAFDAGATDFIAKPISWGLIGHRVRYLLRSYQVLQDLHAANARNSAILNAIPDCMLRLDAHGRVLDLRSATQGSLQAQLLKAGSPLSQNLPEDVNRQLQAAATQAHACGTAVTLDYSLRLDDGQDRQYEARLASIDGDETLCLVRDITERKRQELEIVVTKNKLRDTLDAIPDLLFEVDLDGRFLDYHTPSADLLAAPPELFMGRTVTDVLPPDAAKECLAAVHEANAKGTSTGRQYELPLPHGRRWFELAVSRKTGEFSQAPHFIVLARDITERKEAETSIHRLAYFDTLTGLPNRLSFSERLDREIQRARRHHVMLAVLFLDLDGFKNVNDTLGHDAGDLLLQWVADRLRLGVRPGDVVARGDPMMMEIAMARLGGDEFTVLVPHVRHPEDALGVAHRIHELMRRPFVLEGREVVLTTSIGIALYPDDGPDAATLLKHADTAMYHAKDQGRDNCQFYSASLTQEAMRRLELESNLRRALERGEFFLVYQPQLDLRSGRILSLEALIRWQHPQQGLISPMAFIPVAEENGLIVPIGEWVLRTACADAARWRDSGHPLRVAVNLSPIQLRNPQLLSRLDAILRETGLAAELLELEVTEGALMEDSAATLKTLSALRELGIQLSLDDFGTGYSSLSYLKRLPLHNLKVDQSFVRGLPADRESLAIVRAIVALAKNLGFTITAEGVETPEQANVLCALDCEALQGYYISKPVPVADIPALLTRRWAADEPAQSCSLK